jgi:hypothetical protein
MKSKMTIFLRTSLLICVYTSIVFSAQAQELPKPSHQNTFYMFPIFENIHTPTTDNDMAVRSEMDKMIFQVGAGNLYYQNGSSGVYSGTASVERACRLSKEKGLRLGIIFANQTHTNKTFFPTLNQDIRGYQWRLNGKNWLYSPGQSLGSVLYPGDLRDSGVYSPSRLCATVRNQVMATVASNSIGVLAAMKAYPGVISIVNGIIEEELATGGQGSDGYLGDYSPYAITEYRDWLRHAGIYDDLTGSYKGEGAQAAIVGNFLTINGVATSQFADDPTPADANGTGVSFNTYFGTSFTTWTNKYYDLVAYPNPIPFPVSGVASDFNPTPQSGNGFTAGGFDAPRARNTSNNFWNAWSYDVSDHGGAYPAGDPTSPAFGFRQQMVKNYIKDVFKAYADAGLPTDNMYPHQIPGEAIGDANRLRSGADPIWTGALASSGNMGITRFGYINPALLTKYSPSWGIFEWHPKPNASPYDPVLYSTALSHLNTYYQNGCHALFPGWWYPLPRVDTTFPLPDSQFATAIRDFMAARKEQPYTRQDQAVLAYTPPQVLNVSVTSLNATTDLVRWQQEIWNEYPETWGMWSKTGVFEVQQSTDNSNWTTVENTYGYSSVVGSRVAGTTYYYRVRATNRVDNLQGPYSASITSGTNLTLTPDFATISPPNPEVVDNVAIKLTDLAGNLNTLNSYSAGGSFSRTDASGIKFRSVYTNNNQAEYPSDIKMVLNGTVPRTTTDEIDLKFTPPTGATIDAVTFNYTSNYDNAVVDLQILDDQGQVIWENDVYGVSNGYRGVHFPNTSTYFTARLKMKQTKSGNSISAQVTGEGVALNTLPSNYLQASTLFPLESSAEVGTVNQMTNVVYANGVFSGTTNGNDPYTFFNLKQPINGQANPYIYLRIYSSQAINAQLYWFKPGFYFTTFPLAKGWNVIKLTNLPEWINSTNITALRLDYGGLSNVNIKLDWLAVGSQPYSESLVSLLTVNNGVATLPTSPTGNVGTYRVTATANGTSNFVDINVNNTNLPIKLKSFDAFKDNNEAKLVWITASEANSDYFKIEKSIDGKNFEIIANIKSKSSNSTSNLVYNFSDKNPFTGINYYRLTQYDLDGKEEVLGVKAVSFSLINENEVAVFPNPNHGKINFRLPNNNKGLIKVSIYDLNSRLVYNGSIYTVEGVEVYSLNLPDTLINGVYILKLNGKDLALSKKVILLKD